MNTASIKAVSWYDRFVSTYMEQADGHAVRHGKIPWIITENIIEAVAAELSAADVFPSITYSLLHNCIYHLGLHAATVHESYLFIDWTDIAAAWELRQYYVY